jgi:hypothetical protein
LVTPGDGLGKGRCLLDRELSTLSTRKSVSAFAMHQDRAVRLLLTEITRRREVFPAFCNPIMVTSISVAQNVRNSQSYTFLNSPAMVVDGHAVVERAGSAEGVGRGPG